MIVSNTCSGISCETERRSMKALGQNQQIRLQKLWFSIST